MEQFEINSPEDIGKLLDIKTNHIREMTQKIIDSEIGLIELNLSLSCLDKNHLTKAHNDSEKFKKEMWDKALKLAQKNKSESIEEYKKLINFI